MYNRTSFKRRFQSRCSRARLECNLIIMLRESISALCQVTVTQRERGAAGAAVPIIRKFIIIESNVCRHDLAP